MKRQCRNWYVSIHRKLGRCAKILELPLILEISRVRKKNKKFDVLYNSSLIVDTYMTRMQIQSHHTHAHTQSGIVKRSINNHKLATYVMKEIDIIFF